MFELLNSLRHDLKSFLYLSNKYFPTGTQKTLYKGRSIFVPGKKFFYWYPERGGNSWCSGKDKESVLIQEDSAPCPGNWRFTALNGD